MAVERLEAAGGVIIGRTGLHEFAFGFSSENPWFGPVRNPWNTDQSPGGSSGGSAAAVAAGITPLAIGTDTGGSGAGSGRTVRNLGPEGDARPDPPQWCLSAGRFLDTVGPLGSSVSDLTLAYRAMAGYDAERPVVGTGFRNATTTHHPGERVHASASPSPGSTTAPTEP